MDAAIAVCFVLNGLLAWWCVETDTVAAVRAERTRLIAKLESSLHGSLSQLSMSGPARSLGSTGGSESPTKGLSMVEMVRLSRLCRHVSSGVSAVALFTLRVLGKRPQRISARALGCTTVLVVVCGR